MTSLTDSDPPSKSHLSSIDTLWSLVRRSHDSKVDVKVEAQQKLIEIYGPAIKRYLIASMQNVELAEDLFQEFALKFVQGKFSNVDPAKGQFRYYVKSVLYRLIADHYRNSSAKNEIRLGSDADIAAPAEFNESHEDERFLASWREEILARTWDALSSQHTEAGVSHYAVLQLRVSNPTLSSDLYAKRLSEQLGRTINSGAARVMLHRARKMFATMLIDVIAQSLEEPTRASVEAELIEVRLIDYCRDALESIKER